MGERKWKNRTNKDKFTSINLLLRCNFRHFFHNVNYWGRLWHHCYLLWCFSKIRQHFSWSTKVKTEIFIARWSKKETGWTFTLFCLDRSSARTQTPWLPGPAGRSSRRWCRCRLHGVWTDSCNKCIEKKKNLTSTSTKSPVFSPESDQRSPVSLRVLQPLDKVLCSPRLQVFAVVVGKGSLRVSLHGGQLDGLGQHWVLTE